MICRSCKDNNHVECPSVVAQDSTKPSMALSPEGERVQLTGLCPCQHKVFTRPLTTDLRVVKP